MSEVNNLKTDNFQKEVLESEKPVVVDFWAGWCSPCKKIEPIIKSLCEEFKGQIKFFRLNVDENPSITVKYGVRGIPALFLFKNGEIVDRTVGVVGKKELVKKLKNLL